jgi:uncharacterized protein YmfQ (DUF2313 family)
MTACAATRPAPLRCPSVAESIAATVALLPPGRVWPARDPSLRDRFLAWLQSGPISTPAGYVQIGFFAAIGAARNFLETRLCALRLEFFCATQSETHEQWLAEYGLPDACDPFPDLCLKVKAQGGARCEYFNAIIARLGWRAECFDKSQFCGSRYGARHSRFGRARFGNAVALALVIKVHTGQVNVQPSIESRYRVPRFGRFRYGHRPSCDTIAHPSLTPIRCLMDRIAPAHVQILYIV